MEVAGPPPNWRVVMMMSRPDELQADIYREQLVDNIEEGPRPLGVPQRAPQRPFQPDRTARRSRAS